MIALLRLLIIFMVFTSSTQHKAVVKFNCEFNHKTYRYFDKVNTCKVRDDFCIHQKNMEAELRSGQVYVNIPAISIMNKSVFYLPKGFEKSFPNLEFLEVIQSSLKNITSQNLEPFQKLKYLDLTSNNIQTLESKLFQFNSKLEVLILNDNEISTVDQLTFYSLYSIKFLGFQRNRCFSDVTKDAGAVQKMIESVKFACSEANNRHSMNIENVRKEVTQNSVDIANLSTRQAVLMDANKKTMNGFDAHNRAVEGLRKQLFDRQSKLEASMNQQITSLNASYHLMSANLTAGNTELTSLVNACSQMIQGFTTNATALNMQYQKLSTDLQSLNLTIFSEFYPELSIINNDSLTESITQTNVQNAKYQRPRFSDKLSKFLMNQGIFKKVSDFNEWVKKSYNLVETVDEVKKEINAVKGSQRVLMRNFSTITQRLDQNSTNANQLNQNFSILANLLNLNPENLLSYLLISNIILIFLFLGVIVYLCCIRKSQNTKQTPKPLRIEPPNYRQLVESPTQTPLPTPLILNHNSIYGQYEYIDEHVPITPAFEDFYSDAVRSVRNEDANGGSESYAVVYRPDRY